MTSDLMRSSDQLFDLWMSFALHRSVDGWV
jgi:hypothetical protein